MPCARRSSVRSRGRRDDRRRRRRLRARDRRDRRRGVRRAPGRARGADSVSARPRRTRRGRGALLRSARRRRPRSRASSPSAAPEHARATLDTDAVRRSGVGHPPHAVFEPDLAVAPACVDAVDRDVAAFALADRVAATGNDRARATWRLPSASSIAISTLRPASGVARALRPPRADGPTSDQRPIRVTSNGRAAELGSALWSSARSSLYPSASVLGAALGIEPGELREIDRARIGQRGDHFLREIVLDLFRPELADEPLHELRVVLGAARTSIEVSR